MEERDTGMPLPSSVGGRGLRSVQRYLPVAMQASADEAPAEEPPSTLKAQLAFGSSFATADGCRFRQGLSLPIGTTALLRKNTSNSLWDHSCVQTAETHTQLVQDA